MDKSAVQISDGTDIQTNSKAWTNAQWNGQRDSLSAAEGSIEAVAGVH